MRGVLLFIFLLPSVFANNNDIIITSLTGIAILSFGALIYLYFKISSNSEKKQPEPPFLSEEDIDDREEIQLENIEKEIFAQEEFHTLHADESIKPLTKNQKHIKQLREILARQQASKTDLYKSLHPTHKKHLHKSLHKVVQKYKQRHEDLERQQDKEVEAALDAFARLKQYNSEHKKAQVAGSIDKLRSRTKKK